MKKLTLLPLLLTLLPYLSGCGGGAVAIHQPTPTPPTVTPPPPPPPPPAPPPAPTCTYAYVANFGNGQTDSVSVIDTSTNAIVDTPVFGNGTPNVQALTITPDAKFVYLTNAVANTVSVIDTSNDSTATTILGFSEPFAIAMAPDGTKAYVINRTSSTVSVIDTASNVISSTITLSDVPWDIVVSPDNKTVYVSLPNSNAIAMIDASVQGVTGVLTVPAPSYGVAVSSDGLLLYTAGISTDLLYTIDLTSDEVVDTLSVGVPAAMTPRYVAVAPDGTVYVSDQFGSPGVTVVNRGGNQVLAGIVVGSHPQKVGFGASTGYVPNSDDGTLSVVSNLSTVATVKIGVAPAAVVVSPVPTSCLQK